MNKEITFNIDDNVFNIFTSKEIDISKYYELNQIHSNKVLIVDNNYQNNSIGDAMITNLKDKKLVIKTADCIPILLYDKEHKVIALIHSGWKGTINNIVNNTVKQMINNYNSKSQNIKAYIYPSIRQCHFEVEEDVYKLFRNKIKNIDKYTIKKENKYLIDLQSIIKNQLKEIKINNIYDSDICTYCHHHEFYSYRYNHTEKRNYLIAMIKE